MKDRYLNRTMKKVLKVIQRFKRENECFYINKTLSGTKNGMPLFKETRIPVELAVLTQNQRYFLRTTVDSRINAYSSKYEVFYDYTNSEIKEFQENDVLEINGVLYRVDSVENNYGLFQRLGILNYDRTNNN